MKEVTVKLKRREVNGKEVGPSYFETSAEAYISQPDKVADLIVQTSELISHGFKVVNVKLNSISGSGGGKTLYFTLERD